MEDGFFLRLQTGGGRGVAKECVKIGSLSWRLGGLKLVLRVSFHSPVNAFTSVVKKWKWKEPRPQIFGRKSNFSFFCSYPSVWHLFLQCIFNKVVTFYTHSYYLSTSQGASAQLGRTPLLYIRQFNKVTCIYLWKARRFQITCTDDVGCCRNECHQS